MKIKNGRYTSYNGHQFEVFEIRDEDQIVLLKWEGNDFPDSDFILSPNENNIYYKQINKSQLEIFNVKTTAKYEGFQIDVFELSKSKDVVRIGTRDENVIRVLNLTEGFNGYYMKEMPVELVAGFEEHWTKL